MQFLVLDKFVNFCYLSHWFSNLIQIGFLFFIFGGTMFLNGTNTYLAVKDTQMGRGESMADTARALDQARSDVPFYILADGPAIFGDIDNNPALADTPWKLNNYGMSSAPGQLWLESQYLF